MPTECMFLALRWVLPAVLFLFLCVGDTADALPKVRVQPYIEVTYTPGEVHFAGITGPGDYDATMVLTVKVDTNCHIAGLVLEGTELVLEEPIVPPPPNEPAATLPVDRLSIKATGMPGFVALTAPVVVLGPRGPGHYEFTLNFRMRVETADPPGRYHGTSTITVVPAP